MKTFLALTLIAATLAEDALRDVLRSPKETLKLYKDFKANQHLSFGVGEDRMRFRLFRNNAEFVADANENNDNAVFVLNLFSSMTEEEKSQYLGLNITGHQANKVLLANPGFQAPSQKLWTNEGAVTEVTNQGNCRSGWSFGAVGSLETRYQQKSGKLRKFAEQEYLDCVYEGRKDGCKGGWPSDCYTYSKKNGGRLASARDYKYTMRDASCRESSMPDAAVSHKITGFVNVGSTESANIEALASGSLSVAFEVTNYFLQYSGGIIKDTTCTGSPNHAVTAVGYTASFVLVKNSWGSGWGDAGFVKFSRNHGNCGLFQYSSYPTLTSTGQTDSAASDPATTYRPSEDDDVNPAPKPVCKDTGINCTESICKYDYYAENYCQKTCNICEEEEEDGACPSGTVRCNDGVCRHEHMC